MIYFFAFNSSKIWKLILKRTTKRQSFRRAHKSANALRFTRLEESIEAPLRPARYIASNVVIAHRLPANTSEAYLAVPFIFPLIYEASAAKSISGSSARTSIQPRQNAAVFNVNAETTNGIYTHISSLISLANRVCMFPRREFATRSTGPGSTAGPGCCLYRSRSLEAARFNLLDDAIAR